MSRRICRYAQFRVSLVLIDASAKMMQHCAAQQDSRKLSGYVAQRSRCIAYEHGGAAADVRLV